MHPMILADGRERFERANAERWKQRRAKLRCELEATWRPELVRAGFCERILIRWRIRRAVAALLRKEFPGAEALFLR